MTGPRRAPRRHRECRLPEACSGRAVVTMLVIGGSFMSGCYRDAMSRRGGIAPGESPGSRRGSAELKRGEFGAGAEAELAEHVAQVEVDGARAEEQLGGGVPVGQALPYERGDLPFLGGELGRGGDVAAAGRLAGGAQLVRGAGGPPRGPEV